MISRKHTILSLLWLIAAFSNVGWAKSVYVINDTAALTLQAYKIDGTNLVWQAGYTCVSYVSGGAVGIALDESVYGACLFVTFESDNKIELVNAKSMEYVDTVVAPQAGDLAGAVVDIGKRKVYVIDRQTNHLYVYSWDAMMRELTLDLPAPYYVELQDCSQGFGLALDEVNGRLYVGDNTSTVKYYSTSDWSKLGQFVLTYPVVGIAIDVERQFVYTGSSQFGYSTNLTKYNIGTGIESTVDVGSYVLGIAVNQETGLVYVTTYEGLANSDRLLIYNSDLVKQPWESGDIGNPAGVCVPLGDVSYKPDVFVLSKVDNVVGCVSPPDQFTYSISYSANGHADTGVVITDYLPLEVTYLSSLPMGAYDGPTHTVTWELGDISGSASGTLQIVVQVNYLARVGMTITNAVEMEGALYYSKRTKDTSICCWYTGQTIYVDQDATGYENGTSWVNAYTDLQDALAHVRTCPGAVTAIWVAAGTYKPTQSPSESDTTFELIDGVDMYGHFGGIGTYETSINQRDFENPANESRLEGQIGASPSSGVQYVVTAKNITNIPGLIFDGFTVRGSYGGAGILIEDCPNADLRIVRCKVEDNDQYGIKSTAAALSVSHFELQDCVITGNSTHGLYCTRSWPVISGTTFDGESQTQSGISAAQSAVDVYDSEVRNHAGTGLYASTSNLVADGCLVEENGGTGVECSNCWTVVSRCVIQNNARAGLGSVYLSELEVTECKIRSNGWDGIYLENSMETKIADNWIYGNLGNGGALFAGIYVVGAIDQAHIRNNTICGNNPYGIYLASGTEPEVVNCIVYDNTTQIGTQSGSPLTQVSYSCVQGDPVYPGTGNISDAPLFLNAAAGDYHLTKESLCVDSGKVNSTELDEVDIDANPRVMGGRVDMGGDEDFPHCDQQQYDDWVLLGRPNCWMWPYQCDGDAGGTTENPLAKWRVSANDLSIVLANWKKPAGPTLNPCADIDHAEENPLAHWRVSASDLSIVITNWKKRDKDNLTVPPSMRLPGDCVERGCGGDAMGAAGKGASQLTTKEILERLAEIWLDPEVQKSIDEEKFLKVYESLKGL